MGANFLEAWPLDPLGTLFRTLDDTTGPSVTGLNEASCGCTLMADCEEDLGQGALELITDGGFPEPQH